MSQNNASPVSRSLLTPLKFLTRNAVTYEKKIAVVYGERRFTYSEFAQRVYLLASALKKAGLRSGDRVAFLAPNIPPMLEAHFGVPLAGGVLVAVNTRLASKEIAYILQHSGARFLCVDAELADLIRPVRSELPDLEHVIHIDDEVKLQSSPEGGLEGPEYEEFLQTGEPTELPVSIEDEEEIISINYTSGTTGRPKGVMFTHRGAYLNALGELIETGLTCESVYVWTLPMFHCNGWCFTWGLTASGGTHVCLRKFDPAVVWRLIRDEGVTHFCGAPVVLTALVNHPDRPATLMPSVTVGTAGAPPSPTILGQMGELNAKVVHMYGLTETYGPHTVCASQLTWKDLPADERAALQARQGVGFVATDPVRVVDENMQDVPSDGVTMGEVVMQGNNVMKGYYNDPKATATAFRSGWFHSGDIAVMHPDGYIELRDRGKDVIITGGENVSSIEVEQTIYRHPAVLEVAVVGVPHEKWGESPKAFVTCKEGASTTEEEIIEFCRGELAHFKCPTTIEFTALPKTSTGKIQKFVLREKEWAGREKRIQG